MLHNIKEGSKEGVLYVVIFHHPYGVKQLFQDGRCSHAFNSGLLGQLVKGLKLRGGSSSTHLSNLES